MTLRRKMFAVLGAATLLGAGISIGAGMASKPKSVVHVITMKFKDGTSEDQKKAVRDGIEKMAADPKLGISHVWLKTQKIQWDGFTDIFIMEFKDAAAFAAYTDAPAHKEWEKIYLPVRDQSRTSDITN